MALFKSPPLIKPCSSNISISCKKLKVLESAIANAEHNDGADIDELFVSAVMVDEGTTMKRMSPRAKGRGNRILKRTSHITVVVDEK